MHSVKPIIYIYQCYLKLLITNWLAIVHHYNLKETCPYLLSHLVFR